ncbi:anti-sigma factor domain-containing protein [Niameybacter sp.]|uniref:anti-sigma factor domain-containing protein n=1 Tax=Niameybacter sp. TaxID=2033640 RepID=UPI002FCB2EB0
MLKKGIIVSLSPSFAIVMEKGGAFHKIKLKDAMVIGQPILFTDEDILSQAPSYLHHFRPLMVVAAALILFLIPVLYKVQTPYAIVSLDINPSIELRLNKQGMVKKVISKNKDANTPTFTELKGHPLEQALHNLSTTLTQEGFIQDTPYILVSYAELRNNTLELDTTLASYIATSFTDAYIVYLPSNKHTYSLANQADLSLGRYQASQLLGEHLPDIDFKTIDIPTLLHYLEPDLDVETPLDTSEKDDLLTNLKIDDSIIAPDNIKEAFEDTSHSTLDDEDDQDDNDYPDSSNSPDDAIDDDMHENDDKDSSNSLDDTLDDMHEDDQDDNDDKDSSNSSDDTIDDDMHEEGQDDDEEGEDD